MIKFIIPAIIVFLIVLFWERINDFIYKKFKIKINQIVLSCIFLVIVVVFVLLYPTGVRA